MRSSMRLDGFARARRVVLEGGNPEGPGVANSGLDSIGIVNSRLQWASTISRGQSHYHPAVATFREGCPEREVQRMSGGSYGRNHFPMLFGAASPDMVGLRLDHAVEHGIAGKAKDIVDAVGLAAAHRFLAAVVAITAIAGWLPRSRRPGTLPVAAEIHGRAVLGDQPDKVPNCSPLAVRRCGRQTRYRRSARSRPGTPYSASAGRLSDGGNRSRSGSRTLDIPAGLAFLPSGSR